MVRIPRWTAAALALVTAACGGSSSSGGDVAATPVDCAWLAGDNCWKATAAAATACTDGAAVGAFDGPTTTCTYGDGTTVLFDPSAIPTASQNQHVPWNFTVLTTTATTCARYTETQKTKTLATQLGTFTVDYAPDPILFTCPDGTRFSIARAVATNCASSLFPGWTTHYYPSEDRLVFDVDGAPSTDRVLWNCRF